MRLFKFHRDQRGSVALIVALTLPIFIACAALAVDVGSVFLSSRKLQGMADLAALTAANNLSSAAAAAQATADANGWNGPVTVTVATGTYQGNTSTPVADRFQPGSTNINAAKVTLTAKTDLFFGRAILGKSQLTISRTATAATASLASFSLGSRLASLQGGAANAVLSALTGSAVSLSVADYNALATANVDLLSYAQALHTQAGVQAATFNQTLASNISTGAALTALAVQLDGTNATAAAAMRKLAAAAGTSAPINLSQVLNLGPYGQQDHALDVSSTAVQVDALDLSNAMLLLAQGGRQVQLNLGGVVPGVGQVTAWLAIGQRPSNSPWLAVDDQGNTTIYTVQARLYLNAQIAPGAGVLGAAGIDQVNLPILVDAASASAKLSSLSCAANESVALSVQPSLGHISIATIDPSKLNDFTQPLTETSATFAGVSFPVQVALSGQARADAGGTTWQTVNFSQSDIQAGTVKTVGANDITQSVASSLLGSLGINLKIAGITLPLGQSPLQTALASTLASVAPGIDSLIDGLTGVLGVGLGEADVKMNGVRCGQAALVA